MEVFKRFVVPFQAGQSVLILSGLLHEQLILRAIRLLQNLQKSPWFLPVMLQELATALLQKWDILDYSLNATNLNL